jgi:hypothetical protein
VRLPGYFYFGLAILAVSEIGMLLHVEPFWTWHTAIAWTGYILIVDGFIYKKRGSSWLTTDRREFWFLAAVSIPLWIVFEAYNLLIRNWHYVNLPANPILRNLGFAWAFATIWPAIFETAELVGIIRTPRAVHRPRTSVGASEATRAALVAAGVAMLALPIIWPSPYLAAPVFLGFVFLLDPLNNAAGDESLLGDLRRGTRARLINLAASGLICGFLWEFWNYWARAKWIYDVPILPNLKIFEMPVLGYFGFPAFALECFAMYVLLRRLVWRGKRRLVAL